MGMLSAMNSIKQIVVVASMMIILAACSNKPESQSPDGLVADLPPEWTAEQRTSYQECLDDNRAVTMAWQVTRQQCRDVIDSAPNPMQEKQR